MNKEKLYMFNPFRIGDATPDEIKETYENLQKEIIDEANTGFELASNIETYANMNYLIGEMISRLKYSYETLKAEVQVTENKQIYIQRKQWMEVNTEKAPAMSYFEAMAKEYVAKDLKQLADYSARLYRFQKAYESIDAKENALKKKLEAIRYEI